MGLAVVCSSDKLPGDAEAPDPQNTLHIHNKVVRDNIWGEDLIHMRVRGGLCHLKAFWFPNFMQENVKNSTSLYKKESCCLNLHPGPRASKTEV